MDLLRIRIFSGRPFLRARVAIPGILIVLGVFGAIRAVTPELGPKEAKHRVRLCLQRAIHQRHAAWLRESGKRLPDAETAAQWARELRRVRSLSLHSLALRRPLPDIFWGSTRPRGWLEWSLQIETARRRRATSG